MSITVLLSTIFSLYLKNSKFKVYLFGKKNNSTCDNIGHLSLMTRQDVSEVVLNNSQGKC